MSDTAISASDPRHETLEIGQLDLGSVRGQGSAGWMGMLTLIATEGALFGYLLFSYYYMALQLGRDWLPPELPSFRLSGPGTAILIASSVAVRGRALHQEEPPRARAAGARHRVPAWLRLRRHPD